MRSAGLVLVAFLALPPISGAQELDKSTLDKLKSGTVLVVVDTAYGKGSGSGFLFVRRGTVGYIITCQHVVEQAKSVSIVFNSGTKNERLFEGKIVATDPDRDLACVIIRNAKDLPTPLDIGLKTEVIETQTVYVAGFPFGRMLSADDKNPEISISKSTVASMRRDKESRMVAIQLSGEVNPGNSGGPVIDAKGKVIGVTRSKISGTTTAFAVPPEEIQGFLKGRVKGISFKIASTTATSAKVDVTAALVDPLGTLKGVSVAWCPEKSLSGEPKPGSDGWDKIHPSMKTQTLKIDEEVGVATIELSRGSGEAGMVFLVQTSYVTGDGKTHWTEPAPLEVEFADETAKGKESDKTPDKGVELQVGDEFKALRTLRLRAAIAELLLSPDGSALYALDLSEGKVYSLKPDTLEIAAQVDVIENAVTMCLTPDGKTIYVGARDPSSQKSAGTLQVISTSGLKSTGTFSVAFSIHRLAATNNGTVIATGTGQWGGLAVIDASKKSVSGTVHLIYGGSSIRLHPDQTRVYTGDWGLSPADFHCVFFNKKDKNNQYETYDSPYHGDYPLGGDFEISPDGRYLLGLFGAVVRLGKTRDTDMRYVGKIDKGICMGLAKGSSTFLVATQEGFIKVYDLNSLELKKSIKVGQLLTRIQLDPSKNRIYAITCPMPQSGSSYDWYAVRAGDISSFSLSGK